MALYPNFSSSKMSVTLFLIKPLENVDHYDLVLQVEHGFFMNSVSVCTLG